ncbi:hypothetical protein V1L54_00540 [Streptomyces sp. TRM 70361]|nr:hypothetical protein [Streptomyces sp. TRM 70361]MEE1937921.1 hypothetical protein [Streptomyces sp. TRM 70361]
MYDTVQPEADGLPAPVRALDEPGLPPPPLRLAGDGDEDEGEQHICRGID